jgi:arginine/lysine/ornithine decarboxylase
MHMCSTAGILAAVMACVRRHQQQQQQSHRRPSKVILPLNVHKSAINGLVLSGGEPVFVSPLYDPQLDLCHGLPLHGPGGLAEVLRQQAATGQLACVLLVSPTYHGVLGDVQGAVALCREVGVPLIVDEAHGAHLRFMPRGALLTGGRQEEEEGWDALSLGADVVVQSTHKTLAALSQAGMLHVGRWMDVLDTSNHAVIVCRNLGGHATRR